MQQFFILRTFIVLTTLFIVNGLTSCVPEKQEKLTVRDVMDRVVSDLYAHKSESELAAIDYDQAIRLFTDEELEVLSTRHWTFDVNVPVVVSVMRSSKQRMVPFWLLSKGFVKTKMEVKHDYTTYEVWQKSFDKGEVELGINGFENYGFHYFVSVGAKNKTDKLELSNFFPENQYVGRMEKGAFIYHDWDELVINELPEELVGNKILTTVRGRGVESHLVRAFRKTKFPSSSTPDQVMLTWSSDPETGIDIQWRSDTTIASGVVKYREKGKTEEHSAQAEKFLMEDRLLMNDRYIHRYTARLRNLNAGTIYEYLILPENDWANASTFSTAEQNDEFSFIWLGDTHYKKTYGDLLNKAVETHPEEVAFFTIAGDLVSDGTYRNQWDELFAYSGEVLHHKPFMAVPGNHDNRAGLGAEMYRNLFSYAKNGPDGVPQEQTYSFTYKNTFFLMIDATSGVETHTKWIEEQLANTKATWKIAVFHFPPYNWEEPYYDIQKAWVPLFDKYHVDMVFGGHIHYYMRSKPMKAGKVVASYNEGTAYVISIGIDSNTREIADEPYAEVRKTEGQFYQYLKISENELKFSAIDSEGNMADTFKIRKK